MLKRPRLSVDGWVRKGVHLKTLIDNAVSRRHYTEPSVAAATGEESLSLAESTTVLQETSESKQEAAAALAREKTSEALLLQRVSMYSVQYIRICFYRYNVLSVFLTVNICSHFFLYDSN